MSGAAPSVDLEGTCACGAVTLAVRGRVFSMFMCSCEDCQRATGTGHSTAAMVRGVDVTVSGPVKGFDFTADSGATFTRHFCAECGTPLFGRSSRAPQMMMLPVGFFGRTSDWFRPGQLLFARSHRAWDEVAEDVARHESYRPGGTP